MNDVEVYLKYFFNSNGYSRGEMDRFSNLLSILSESIKNRVYKFWNFDLMNDDISNGIRALRIESILDNNSCITFDRSKKMFLVLDSEFESIDHAVKAFKNKVFL